MTARDTVAVLVVLTGVAVCSTPVGAQGQSGHPSGGPGTESSPAGTAARGGHTVPTTVGTGGGVLSPPTQSSVRIPPRIPVALRYGLSLYGWPYLTAESYAIANAAAAAPRPLTDEAAPKGGLQLAVEPRSARVYVDGSYVGTVESFSGYYQHLTLSSGPHRIEMLAPSYEPLTLDVSIVPDRTTTYRDSLTRASSGR